MCTQAPVVVIIHGGFWKTKWSAENTRTVGLVPDFLERGFAVALVLKEIGWETYTLPNFWMSCQRPAFVGNAMQANSATSASYAVLDRPQRKMGNISMDLLTKGKRHVSDVYRDDRAPFRAWPRVVIQERRVSGIQPRYVRNVSEIQQTHTGLFGSIWVGLCQATPARWRT